MKGVAAVVGEQREHWETEDCGLKRNMETLWAAEKPEIGKQGFAWKRRQADIASLTPSQTLLC